MEWGQSHIGIELDIGMEWGQSHTSIEWGQSHWYGIGAIMHWYEIGTITHWYGVQTIRWIGTLQYKPLATYNNNIVVFLPPNNVEHFY